MKAVRDRLGDMAFDAMEVEETWLPEEMLSDLSLSIRGR